MSSSSWEDSGSGPQHAAELFHGILIFWRVAVLWGGGRGWMIGSLGYSPLMPASKINLDPLLRVLIPLTLRPQQTMPFGPNPGLNSIPSRPIVSKPPISQPAKPPGIPSMTQGVVVPCGSKCPAPASYAPAPMHRPQPVQFLQGRNGNPIVIPIPTSSVPLPHQNPASANSTPSASLPQQVPAPGAIPASSPLPAASPAPASPPPSPSTATPSAPPKGS